ncbi:MAG: EscU/YscU/HrcU family type III secretion system export apparatus switch protein, partial [Rhodospirillales bacterium]|nr:EscU/YscU/HrcU family type III secretion system export apparatus switch protein [Rhodospirillales bacterium]
MAEEEDDSQKTEDPTQRKLNQASKKGQVSQSQEVKNWAILLGGAMGIIIMTPKLMKDVTFMSIKFLESGHDITMDQNQIRFLFYDILTDLGIAMAPIMGLLLLIAVFSNVVQSGLIYAPDKINPDFSKLSLIKGLKQKFSL